MHLSLGAKLAVYKKPTSKAADARFHIDVFVVVVTERVLFDGRVVCQDNAWTILIAG